MTHQVLASKFDYVQVAISEVLSVREHRSEHAISVLGSEREDQGPVQQPACLMEHAHGTLSEACADHVLNLTNGGQLSALTSLSKLNLAGEQAPEDLRDELVMSVRLGAENFFQDEKIVVRLYRRIKLDMIVGKESFNLPSYLWRSNLTFEYSKRF